MLYPYATYSEQIMKRWEKTMRQKLYFWEWYFQQPSFNSWKTFSFEHPTSKEDKYVHDQWSYSIEKRDRNTVEKICRKKNQLRLDKEKINVTIIFELWLEIYMFLKTTNIR